MFTIEAKVDGTDIAPITLAGARIDYGRTVITDQPSVPTAVLEILTRDAYPIAGDLYPEFGLGDWASDLSGFADIYADAYTGVTSRITLGVPVTIQVDSSGGFEDIYRDAYEGFSSRRFTGTVQAIDYTPGLIQLTCAAKSEAWSRILVGGTAAGQTIPVEYDKARATRLALEAGISLTVDGPDSVKVTAVPEKTNPRPLMDWLNDIAADTDGLVYTDRDGWVHVRTRDWPHPDPTTVYLPPGATLVDPLQMSTDLGTVRNHITVEYGGPLADGTRAAVTVVDTDSITRYGRRDYREATIIEEQIDAQTHADRLNDILAANWTMPDAVVTLALVEEDRWKADLLSIDQGTNVLVPKLLPGSPMPDYPATVIGYTEELAVEDWRITFHLAARRYPGPVYSPTLIYPAPNTYQGDPQ